MSKQKTLIAVGGGEIAGSTGIADEIVQSLSGVDDRHVTVMTVATSEPREAATKYNSLFRSRGINHVSVVNIDQRNDSFAEAAMEKVAKADAIFFTGGDQLNITSLLGGSPMHQLIEERHSQGVIIAGTSAGAAMMSCSMIVSGASDEAPKVSGVEIGPGMNLIFRTIVDTHFSQRGRHGRLMTAVAHSPHLLGLGIDEATAIVLTDREFRVVGDGVVTVVDGSDMNYSNLPYRHDGEAIGMFGVRIHVLPNGHSFSLEDRCPIAPELGRLTSAANN